MAADPYRYFRIEARELVDELGSGMLALERGGATAADVAKLLRYAHTLKGAARIVKHAPLAELAHALEDALEPLRGGATAAIRLDAALALIDQMATHVAQLPAPATATPTAAAATTTAAPAPALAPAAATVPATPAVPATALTAPRIDAAALDELVTELAEVRTQLARVRTAADPRALTQALLAHVPAHAATTAAADLDAAADAFHRALALRIDHVERELEQARHDADRLRLLPASAVVAALERTARDAALATGVQIAFTATGVDVRVDAQIIAGVHGALVQLVRNALAHAIESPAERLAAGKPAAGAIALTVSLRGSSVAFTVSDDGRGIDLDAIRHAARRRGLSIDEPGAAAGTDDTDALLRLLLRGGISTAASVTAAAGRGIGLDVVRAAAAELGGTVHAHTARGRGSAFEIVVPVTLAALVALAVEAGGRIAAIPIDAVRRVIRVPRAELASTGLGQTIAFDDLALPFVPLARILGAAVAAAAQVGAPAQAIDAVTAVIVEAAGQLVALGIDRPLGADDLVIRAVPAGAPVGAVVRGFALDRAGHPRPVLDPAELVAAVRGVAPPPLVHTTRALPILVVDDSLTTRMLEQSILESAGYEVEVATSAEDALDKLRDHRYALLLVDVEMPGMTGFELIAMLRARTATAAIPAILVSSRDAPEDLRRGVEVGAQGYMIKSRFDQVELLALIARLTSTSAGGGAR